jgi:hypothetical protein
VVAGRQKIEAGLLRRNADITYLWHYELLVRQHEANHLAFDGFSGLPEFWFDAAVTRGRRA